jgi:hypothetical protein
LARQNDEYETANVKSEKSKSGRLSHVPHFSFHEIKKQEHIIMKLSWGHKILFVYLGFVAGILFLGYKASQQKFDLVTPNYYESELKFQNVIDDKQRVADLSAQPEIKHSVNKVSIQLPDEFLNKNVKGELYLYRPSDASKDVRKSFSTDKSFIEIALDESLSGAYEVKLSWQADGKTFYNEQRIFF